MAGGLCIRPARPDDRPAAERICANTWDWGDYIPEVWDAWLADEQGHLAVAELDGQVVALGRVTMQPGGQAWLEGMRVDPNYRRHGIAWQFFHYKLAYAHTHGARVARLGTGDYNQAAHRMLERVGMERIGRYELLTAPARSRLDRAAQPKSGSGPLAQLAPEHADRVVAFLRKSPVLIRAQGLYCLDWAWQELSDARAVDLLAWGQLIGRWGSAGSLQALAVVQHEPDEERLWVGFADAGPQAGPKPTAIETFAHELRVHAHRCGCKWVAAMLPDLPWLREAFRAADYGYIDWEGELWVYEMPLDPPLAAGDVQVEASWDLGSPAWVAEHEPEREPRTLASQTPGGETET